ncbi:sugar phosphate nucleotidyltransferase [Natronogracilivirga saccharolytica]|uniref:Glucose-1-phosphate thymidylyltransferase n=1 Tax=Natronogracilivirga saccharolytica TaxID=2812953 RepID=A0A8J7S3X3_9BACT|nr:sugar phosphate nucleotidyltransferase [Natronogracilivirga saccharolytica]MBP3191533.1 glucose-1-phosphate thymidylyltransferase [Natronogracilivirga saccharolytica]
MKLIIPMAGRGTRLRPHSLLTPKPLLPVAGPTLIERIIRMFGKTINRPITEIAFILGDFGDEVEEQLAVMTRKFGAEPAFYHQKEALGTAHAIYCAAPSLDGEVIIAFADTLFELSGQVDLDNADSIIWLKKVRDPSQYGVAVRNGNRITRFVEKPQTPVSDLAIIGVYYFKEGERLKEELKHLLDNDIRGHKNEFDLTDAIDSLLQKKAVFRSADVKEWLDFGTLDAWLSSTAAVMDRFDPAKKTERTFPDTRIIQPCFIGDNVSISGSTIGPYATIGEGCTITDSTISNSIIRENAVVENCTLDKSTVGASTQLHSCNQQLHVGDFSVIKPPEKSSGKKQPAKK